jgi:hypothetical protein
MTGSNKLLTAKRLGKRECRGTGKNGEMLEVKGRFWTCDVQQGD